MAEEEVLTADEIQALREVMGEFRQSIESGGWEARIKQEAKRRVSERKQAQLLEVYQEEVAKLPDLEARLRLRSKFREHGLKI